ncbi:cytosolic carboxypeptidase 6-like [Galleria mellonella]|uniref:Cytosolic carboxypeptidase 6-like n=1 Tax=Galleria mellonella TaxID=7137 RepID=A0ABM3N4L4_GALME|nr:cytosolic carboxypeptidase 6-like [Galleria mellonella]
MAAHTDQLEHTSIYNRDPDDSEESDGEGGLGNLNRLIVRPPGQSGKAKRGQLCFDAAYECGNLGRADYITDLEYDLFIRPDTCRPRCRFWFNFTIENVKQDQRVIFNIVNLGKEHTLFNRDMTPLVRSTSRQKWQRLPRRLLFYHRSLVHRGRKILSIAFAFDREEDIYQFASAAPYSYSRLQRHLTLWEKKAQTFATRESIAQTTQKRRIDLITIGDFDFKDKEREPKQEHATKNKASDNKKRVVLILSRTHGGEQPASFICQVSGFLDYMVSSSEKASALRNNIVLQIVPMLNPDGVFLGNQRSDLFGADLNRCWHRPTTFAHPALIAVKELVRKLTSEKNVQMDFIIDIHSDISHEGVFVRGNSYDDVYRFERHAVLPKFLATRVEAWRAEACLYNSDSSVTGSARRTLPTGGVDAYTLIASMGGRRLTPRGPYLHYTEDAYAKIGRSLAKALCDYYRHIGVIPPRVGLTKKKESRGRRRRRRPAVERERSPSSSPERRVLAARVVSPPLPAASPPPLRALPPRPAHSRHSRHTAGHTARPRTEPDVHAILPLVTGTAVRTPRLAVVDMSAYIRSPTGASNLFNKSRSKLARPPRPSHPKYTSDEYETHESDS